MLQEGHAVAVADVGRRNDGQYAAEGVDLIYGGFPCQDVSVAGQRRGLEGDRSGLWFEFERILSELRPRWAVIENVPGLLSSNIGNDFRVILDGLCELGYSVGWTILDAQAFGVPQRRRRVFVIAGPGVGSVRSVLSLCESCGGNPETGREAREGVAGTLGGGSGSRGWSSDTDRATFIPIGIDGGDTRFALRANASHSGDKGDGGVNTTLVTSTLRGHKASDDDAKAPSFARTVDIHRKVGYDPVEMHFDPATQGIPLDATLIGGSHGAPATDPSQCGVLLSSQQGVFSEQRLSDTDVAQIVLRQFGV